jgi:hypothetical protein
MVLRYENEEIKGRVHMEWKKTIPHQTGTILGLLALSAYQLELGIVSPFSVGMG